METIRYQVRFKQMPERNDLWELRLSETLAHNCGNGSRVDVYCNGERYAQVDSRFDRTITHDFVTWCNAYMESLFDPQYEPVIEKLAGESMAPTSTAVGPCWKERHWGRRQELLAKRDPLYRIETSLNHLIAQLEEVEHSIARLRAGETDMVNDA